MSRPFTALIAAFQLAARDSNSPKVKFHADGVEWTLAYIRPGARMAKTKNYGSVTVASGRFGSPTAKWGGRILADGSVEWGRDATPALAEALAAIPTDPLPVVQRSRKAMPTPEDRSERHLSLAYQEEQHSARWEHNYGGDN